MPLSEIALRLEEERRRIGLSKSKFARQLDVSRESLRLYESGKRNMSAETLERAAENGVDVLYVLTGNRMTATSTLPPALVARGPQDCQKILLEQHMSALYSLVGEIVQMHLERVLEKLPCVQSVPAASGDVADSEANASL